MYHSCQVAEARKKAEGANEKLESLISLYRKQLRMHTLKFVSVAGTTHLIEVMCLMLSIFAISCIVRRL